MPTRKLIILVHAYSKVGKTWLGMTAPGPRLYLDAEARTEYAPTNKVGWDGLSDPSLLEPDPDDTVLVSIRSWGQMESVASWIQSGRHPFMSVVIDSLTEVQKQLIIGTAGGDRNPKIDEWGIILRKGEGMCRFYRDTLRETGQPLQMVVMLAGTEDLPAGEGSVRRVPYLQGALQKSISYPFDVVGYMYGTNIGGKPGRALRVGPLEGFECGDGTNLLTEHYGPTINNPNLSEMFSVLQD